MISTVYLRYENAKRLGTKKACNIPSEKKKEVKSNRSLLKCRFTVSPAADRWGWRGEGFAQIRDCGIMGAKKLDFQKMGAAHCFFF